MSILRRQKAAPEMIEDAAPSPRDVLAHAIERASAASEAAERGRGAVRLAERMVLDAEGRHVRADAALKAARQSRASSIAAALATEAAGGEAIQPGAGTREARLAEIDAAEDLEAARQALAAVSEPQAGLEADEARTREAVTEAAGVVLSAEIPRLYADAMAVLADLTAQARILSFIARADSRATFHPERRDMVRGADALVGNVFSTHMNLHGRHVTDQASDVTAPWRAALEALKVDAAAPLPSN